MGVISVVLLVILVVSAVLLVLVVLVQDDQGEGLGGIFGGGSTTPFGSRSGNVLTRFTAILAAVFLFSILGIAWVNKAPEAGNVIGRAREQALKGGQQQNWWVQTPSPSATGTSGTPITPGANPAPAPQSSTTAPANPSASPPAAPAKGGN
ncbi:MAG TPA: preprotein translocase subunit SecG [Spirochaetia bacterium]|nr:preprotein translocase subunit SecG [Spirochaetia bacterium]